MTWHCDHCGMPNRAGRKDCFKCRAVRVMPRRLPTIGHWINAHMAPYGFRAVVTKSPRSTACGASQRDGNRLVVYRGAEMLLDHDAATTYRSNADVEQWLRMQLVSLKLEPQRLSA